MAQIIWAQGSRVNKGQRDTLALIEFLSMLIIDQSLWRVQDLSFLQTGLIIDHSFGHIQETLWTKSASRWAKAKSISPPARSTKNIRSDGKLSSLVHHQETKKDRENEERSYKEAFDYFDWNKSGTIPTRSENINATKNDALLIITGTLVNWLQALSNQHPVFFLSDLQCAMRRAGQNPTDVEVFSGEISIFLKFLFSCYVM